MKGNRYIRIRRIMIGGLLAMAIIGLVMPGWTTGLSMASRDHYSPQDAMSQPALSKNNLPEAHTQDLPESALNAGEYLSAASSSAPAQSVQNHTLQKSGVPVQTAMAVQASAVDAAQKKEQKTVYLTFDDGPSSVTPKVLEILRQQQVQATFFVLGEQSRSRPELINAIWEQGHAIGNHTYNHNYHDLYSGFTQFWTQIKQTEELIRGITGVRPQLVRAPGGTFGHFDGTYFNLLEQAGYSVMDWTVDSGDSKRKGVPSAEIVRESTLELKSPQVILLLHDGAGHEESAAALPEIIKRYKAAGYVFDRLDAAQQPVQFRVSGTAAGLSRSKPSQAWIQSNIVPNAGLFAPGKPLVLEVGRLETKLAPGEYRISQGQYRVPLRAVIERLGGQVSWDSARKSGQISWNNRVITVDTAGKRIVLSQPDGSKETIEADVQMLGASLWIPLRELLEAAGHPPLEVGVTSGERRVKAL